MNATKQQHHIHSTGLKWRWRMKRCQKKTNVFKKMCKFFVGAEEREREDGPRDKTAKNETKKRPAKHLPVESFNVCARAHYAQSQCYIEHHTSNDKKKTLYKVKPSTITCEKSTKELCWTKQTRWIATAAAAAPTTTTNNKNFLLCIFPSLSFRRVCYSIALWRCKSLSLLVSVVVACLLFPFSLIIPSLCCFFSSKPHGYILHVLHFTVRLRSVHCAVHTSSTC